MKMFAQCLDLIGIGPPSSGKELDSIKSLVEVCCLVV
jgi:hypothetical protein